MVSLNINEDAARKVILMSRVEKILRDKADSTEIQQIILGSFLGENFVCGNGQYMLSPQTSSTADYYYDDQAPFSPIPLCEPTIMSAGSLINGYPGKCIMNGSPDLQTRLFYLRLSLFATKEIRLPDPALFPYGALCPSDFETALYLSHKFEISGNWTGSSGNDNGPWKRVHIDGVAPLSPHAFTIPVYHSDNSLAYIIELWRYKQQTMVLPVSFFQHPKFPCPLKLYVPPTTQSFPFFNAEKITMNSDATVYITDEIGIVLENQPSPDQVIIAIVGGDDAIDQLDITPLIGRNVVMILPEFDDRIESSKAYTTAIKMARRLHHDNIRLEFMVYRNFQWQKGLFNQLVRQGVYFPTQTAMFDQIERHNVDTVVKNAKKLGIIIPNELEPGRFGLIDIDAIKQHEAVNFQIENLLEKGGITVMAEHPGVEPFYLSNSIALATANGKEVFPGNWRCNGHGHKVVVFVQEESLKKYVRLRKNLCAEYGSPSGAGPQLNTSRFFSEKPEEAIKQFRGAIETQNPSMIIFDTPDIFRNGNTANGFVSEMLRVCRDNGIGVIIVCNEELSGQRNWQSLKNAADRVIHVWRKNQKNISFIIEEQEGVADNTLPFMATLCRNDLALHWEVSSVSDDELAKLEQRSLPALQLSIDPSFEDGLKILKDQAPEDRIKGLL